MTIACEASARRMSLSLIPPTPLSRIADRHLGVFELLELLGEGLERALDVGLEDQVEALDLLLGHLAVEVFERDGLAFGQGGVAGADAAGLGDLAGAGDVVDDGEVLAGGGDDVEPGDLDRGRRAGLARSSGPGRRTGRGRGR